MAVSKEQREEAKRLEEERTKTFLADRKTAQPVSIVVRGRQLTVTHKGLHVYGTWRDAEGVVHLAVEVSMKTVHRTFSSTQTSCGQEILGEVAPLPSFIPLSCLACIAFVDSETMRTV